MVARRFHGDDAVGIPRRYGTDVPEGDDMSDLPRIRSLREAMERRERVGASVPSPPVPAPAPTPQPAPTPEPVPDPDPIVPQPGPDEVPPDPGQPPPEEVPPPLTAA